VARKVREKLQKVQIIVQQDGPVCILKCSDMTNVTMISSYHVAEVQTINMRGKGKQMHVYVIHYN
jgi:hypothetical protein